MTTPEERERILARAKWNPFLIRADDVLIDLLTDSGTGAMSAQQWGAIMIGDESYAGSRSFFRFEQTIRSIFGLEHVIPTHQGRAAERILMSIVGGEGKIIPSNNHFDTTRANIEFTGAEAYDLVIPEGHQFETEHPFKGNIDLDLLKELLEAKGDRVPIGMLTVTNNTGGGQPVSMANIRGASELYRSYGVPFFIDACRFAENAYFIKMREPGYENRSVRTIAAEMFSYADGVTMSLKKDGFGNIGGFLAVSDPELADNARNILILTEGFPTYGGLAGRDMEALAIGLQETLDDEYLEYRHATVRFLATKLVDAGLSIIQPPGGHAVYLNAAKIYDHIPAEQFPAQALVCDLYSKAGIRGVEIGSLMFGRNVDGQEIPADRELVRLALPRRVYTQAHITYVAEALKEIYEERSMATGLRIIEQAPFLRHFTAHLERLGKRI